MTQPVGSSMLADQTARSSLYFAAPNTKNLLHFKVSLDLIPTPN
jgi:hypothetical protein